MHPSVMVYVADQVEACNLADAHRVLEVGSYDVNGTVRPLFTGDYIGVDLRPGPGVDHVADAAALPFGDNHFAVVVSTEMLEHDTRPWRSITEMARVLRPGGHLILTARGYDERGCFPLHDFPADHWRYSTGGIRELLVDARLIPVDVRPDPEHPGVLCVATKP